MGQPHPEPRKDDLKTTAADKPSPDRDLPKAFQQNRAAGFSPRDIFAASMVHNTVLLECPSTLYDEYLGT